MKAESENKFPGRSARPLTTLHLSVKTTTKWQPTSQHAWAYFAYTIRIDLLLSSREKEFF